MNKENLRYYILNLFIILLVISIGLFAINQFVKYKYNIERLMTPCELCVKLNPEWRACYNWYAYSHIVNTSIPASIPVYYLNITPPLPNILK